MFSKGFIFQCVKSRHCVANGYFSYTSKGEKLWQKYKSEMLSKGILAYQHISYIKTEISILAAIKLVSANALNLDRFKSLLYGI